MTQEEIKRHKEEKFNQWLDNTDLSNLGIIKWARDLLPEYVPNQTPKFHITILMMLLTLLDPDLKNKFERLRNIIVFRGGAKSTLINKLFAAYLLANNGKTIKVRRIKFNYDTNGHIIDIVPLEETFEVTLAERFIVLASETGGSAESIIVDLRNEFDSNSTLKYYYKVAVADAKESDTGQWTQKAFKLNNCYIMGVGTGYQIRGKIRGASRPTFMIFDDIYSENNIGENERPKIARWFNNAAFNSIDDVKGKAVVINTIVHEDTIPVHLKDDMNWRTIEIPLMPLDKFHKFIDEHMKVDYGLGKCTLVHDDIVDDMERRKKQHEYYSNVQSSADWELAWGDRITLYELALKFRGVVSKHNTSGLYQEYFHKVLSPEDQNFKKEYFQRTKYELKYQYGYNWIKLEGEEQWQVIEIEFGIDQSSGFGKDNSWIVAQGTLADDRVIVFPPVYGKWTDRDDVFEAGNINLNKVQVDRSAIKKIGIIDETYRQYLIYHPSKIKIGVAGGEVGSAYKWNRVFTAMGVYGVQIFERPQTAREKTKAERIKSTLLGYYQTRMVYHTANCEELEHQLEFLGKADMDDGADAAEVAFWRKSKPFEISIGFFEEQKDTKKITDKIRFDWITS